MISNGLFGLYSILNVCWLNGVTTPKFSYIVKLYGEVDFNFSSISSKLFKLPINSCSFGFSSICLFIFCASYPANSFKVSPIMDCEDSCWYLVITLPNVTTACALSNISNRNCTLSLVWYGTVSDGQSLTLIGVNCLTIPLLTVANL